MTMRELKDFLFRSSGMRNSRMREKDYKVRIDSIILDETSRHRYQNIIIILSHSAPTQFSLGLIADAFRNNYLVTRGASSKDEADPRQL
jgi:hypothetical protein